MHGLLHHVRTFLKREDGATMAEYVVLMAAITLAVIVAIRAWGDSIKAVFTTVADETAAEG